MQDKHDAEVSRLEGIISDLKTQIQNLLQQLDELEQSKQGVEQQLAYTEGLIQGFKDQVTDAEARTKKSLQEHQERTTKVERDFLNKE